MLSVNGDVSAEKCGSRKTSFCSHSRKSSHCVPSRKLSARMDSEVQEAFRLFDKDKVRAECGATFQLEVKLICTLALTISNSLT